MKPPVKDIEVPLERLQAHYKNLLDKWGSKNPNENRCSTVIKDDIFDLEEVVRGLRKLKNTKALGGSFVSAELLKYYTKNE